MDATTRAAAQRLDAQDALSAFRERFVHDDPKLIYLDGNSLGRLPIDTVGRITTTLREEWGDRLIRAWPEHWYDIPRRVGDVIGTRLLGAAAGQVILADSTTVNFFKLAGAALAAAGSRRVVVTDTNNFPTDRYVLQGLVAAAGLQLRHVEFDEIDGPTPEAIASVVDSDTALVTLSHVDYRSGALADLAAINEVAHRAGARVLWDLSHTVGSVPVELDRSGTDLAVGCTYKYLNGGPGAPAFLYVRADLQSRLRAPIWGWFGQRDQFAMGAEYDPVPGLERFLSGTPNILGAVAAEEGVAVVAEAGIDRIRAKSMRLTDFVVTLADAWLADLDFRLGSPRDATRRGSHVSLRHPRAHEIVQALIEQADVLPDFRAPDRIRLGLAPLTTRFVDVWDALDRLRRLVRARARSRPRARAALAVQ